MNELFLLCYKRGIADKLKFHAQAFSIDVPDIVRTLSDRFMAEIEPKTLEEPEIIESASKLMTLLAISCPNCDVLHPGNMTQYFKITVEYGGFCPMAAIKRQIAVPGDKNIGLVRYDDHLFAFENTESAIEFFKSPLEYMLLI